ncbi:MAG: DNA repair protein RecO [Erysipelotrichia bacterium]|jgi:DNA repair protein RecO|nr:DNA repair protein RecO [Erysipelotrichia bacterium]
MEIVGLITRFTQFKENDAMISVVTLDKIYSFLARGVLKVSSKNKASIQPFTKSQLQISRGKEGYSLRTGIVLESYEHAKAKLESLLVLSLIGELTNKVITNEEVTNIYPFLEQSFILLNEDFHPLTIALIYFANVLKVIGLSLEVNKCVISGQTSEICAISLIDGGLISKDAFDPLKHAYANERKINIYRQIFLAQVKDMNRVAFLDEECLEILKELSMYLSDNAGTYLKSLKLINETF